MKNTYMSKAVLTGFVFVFWVALAPATYAHDAGYTHYQQNDSRYQYQVYGTPVQTQYQSQQQTQYNNQDIQFLLQQIAQLQRLLLQLQSGAVIDSRPNSFATDDSEVEVETRSATDIQDESARLRGVVADFNRSDYADVWFEYGRSRNDLDMRTPILRIDEDEDEDFDLRIGGLRDDTRYYFRAVAEDDDEERDYGSIDDFETDDDDRNDFRDDDAPDVTLRSAFDIDEDSARFEGEVDMNDFRNGEVFFVYGEDEDQIDDVADDYNSYFDVDEDGNDLQKFRVESDLDGDASYEARITGLDDNSDYYFILCVGYEDEDDDDVLECSTTREFETD
jgi:hypothetical protein